MTGGRMLRGDHNQCPGCHEYFNSTAAFEKHRVGEYGTGPNGSSPDRRCLTVAEMRDKGMSDASGWWVTRPSNMPIPGLPVILGDVQVPETVSEVT
jgi:hypothetical protein